MLVPAACDSGRSFASSAGINISILLEHGRISVSSIAMDIVYIGFFRGLMTLFCLILRAFEVCLERSALVPRLPLIPKFCLLGCASISRNSVFSDGASFGESFVPFS